METKKKTLIIVLLLCLPRDLKIDATSICKICKDKKSLCTKCAQRHIEEKIEGDHELCEDMEKYTTNTDKNMLNCE